jgi:hypothetical protein
LWLALLHQTIGMIVNGFQKGHPICFQSSKGSDSSRDCLWRTMWRTISHDARRVFIDGLEKSRAFNAYGCNGPDRIGNILGISTFNNHNSIL